MTPATAPRSVGEIRVLVVRAGSVEIVRATDLASVLFPSNLVVVNDAGTLPASIEARTERGHPLEIRLLAERDAANAGSLRFDAALLGRGDHRTRTEARPAPPVVARGSLLVSTRAPELVGEVISVSDISPRLMELRFTARSRDGEGQEPSALWTALYRAGKPVQYAHVPEPLALWDVQNPWAARPWAVELPSAGRALRTGMLVALRRAGIGVASVTHAAGLSATGDPAIDARLPLPERWHVPIETVDAVHATRAAGGRVVAVGTSVVRALESAARSGTLTPGEGVTDLLLGPGSKRRVVDAVLTGVHEPDTSHFALLGAFIAPADLDRALRTAEREGFLGHEFGDAWLAFGDATVRELASHEREPHPQADARPARTASHTAFRVC